MTMLDKWEKIIEGRGGKYNGHIARISAKETEAYVSGVWLDRTKENKNNQKQMRDITAQELRKAKWTVWTRTNSSSYTVGAEYIIKHDKASIDRYKNMERIQREKFEEFLGRK